mgnify:CR=1 FL=1
MLNKTGQLLALQAHQKTPQHDRCNRAYHLRKPDNQTTTAPIRVKPAPDRSDNSLENTRNKRKFALRTS